MSRRYVNNNNSYRVPVLVTWGRPKSARESMISVWRSPEEFLSWNEVQTTSSTFLLYYNRYRAGAFLDLSLTIVTISLVVLPRHVQSLQILFSGGHLGTNRLTYRFLSAGNPPLPSYEWYFRKKHSILGRCKGAKHNIFTNSNSYMMLIVYFLKVLQCTLINIKYLIII